MGYLPAAQFLYSLVQVLGLATWAYVYQKIMASEEDEGRIGEKTIQEYDVSKLKEKLIQVVNGICVVAFLHYKWGYVLPLVIHMCMTPVHVWESPLTQIYVMEKKAQGDLGRPFSPPSARGSQAADNSLKKGRGEEKAAQKKALKKAK